MLLLTLLLLAAMPGAAQQAAPPSTRRCRWVRLRAGRDTTTFMLPDTLTVVPSSVTANGRSVGYDCPHRSVPHHPAHAALSRARA